MSNRGKTIRVIKKYILSEPTKTIYIDHYFQFDPLVSSRCFHDVDNVLSPSSYFLFFIFSSVNDNDGTRPAKSSNKNHGLTFFNSDFNLEQPPKTEVGKDPAQCIF